MAPLDSQTRYELAVAYLSMNHGDWARPELEKLEAADPANPLYQVLARPARLRRRSLRGGAPSASKRSSKPTTRS